MATCYVRLKFRKRLDGLKLGYVMKESNENLRTSLPSRLRLNEVE